MKKIIIIGLLTCLSISMLIGCGKKEEADDFSGPVIIQAGDSAVGSGGKKETQSANEKTKETESNTKVEQSTEVENAEEKGDKINLVGTWLGSLGNCLEIRTEEFSAYFNGNDIGGTYEIKDNVLVLNYGIRTELEDVTEEQKLLGKTYIIEDVTSEYKVESYNPETTFILNYGNSKEVFKYFGAVVETDADNIVEITDEAELQKIREELESQGINPDTGLKLEDEQKLIEMGIDPLTGLPLEVEETNEASETLDVNKN